MNCLISSLPYEIKEDKRSKQGSTLLLAIIFTTVLTTLAGSIIARVMHERTLAQQSLVNASLLYLTEGFIEKAMWAINNDDWSGWDTFNEGEDRYMPFTRVDLGDQEAFVHALVISADDNPTIYAEARAAPGDGRSLDRQVRIEYEVRSETTGDEGSGIPGGMIFEDQINMGGQAMIDAYDSRKGPYDRIYNRTDKVTVATTSTAADAFNVNGQVDIYGYAGTGREQPVFGLSGPLNKLYGPETPSGTNWDWSRTYGDFSFDPPPIVQPDWSGALPLPNIRSNQTTVIGTPGVVTKYSDKDIKLSGNSNTKLLVAGPVKIYLSDGLSTTSNAHIEVAVDASMEIYTPDEVSVTGMGVINRTQRPENVIFYGTNTSKGLRSLKLAGQGDMYIVVYAPDSHIHISGQGDLYGSLTGYQLHQKGQGGFHYDISLGGGDTTQGEETIRTIGGVTNWHDTTSVLYSFDIESYVTDNGGTFHIAI